MIHIRDRRDREALAKRRMRHRRPIPIVLTVLAVGIVAGCEDFQITDHTVMDGSRPPEVIQVPERALSSSEVIGRWKIGAIRTWPDVACALEVGTNGKFLWTSVDDLNCTFTAGPMGPTSSSPEEQYNPPEPQKLTTTSGTWRVDDAVAEGTVSYFNMHLQKTVEIRVGGHLREVRPGTYCVVGIRLNHLDILLPENPIPDPSDPLDERPYQEPNPDGRLKCLMVVQRAN